MGLLREFREFALRGSVVDLAVGVIIGAAFGLITKSMVDDILMPPIGKMIGNLDFANLYISLSDAVDAANNAAMQKVASTQPAVPGGVLSAFNTATRLPLAEARKLGPVIAYGNFITTLINFVIVAFCVFLIIKLVNAAMKRFASEPPPPAPPTKEQELLTEIRDLLKSRAT
jgi:large conductance mechanosensitive channel